jgi:hypothetical protein
VPDLTAAAEAANTGSTVELWQAILIGIAAGLGGGLLGTMARISYERTAELRTRMIEAADDFSTNVFRTIAGLRDAHRRIDQHADYVINPVGEWHPAIQQVIDQVAELADHLHERLARLELLFGPSEESHASEHANNIVVAVRNCQNAIRQYPHSVTGDPTARTDRPARQKFNENYARLVTEHSPFSSAARREIRAGFLASLWRRVWSSAPFRQLRAWYAGWRGHSTGS